MDATDDKEEAEEIQDQNKDDDNESKNDSTEGEDTSDEDSLKDTRVLKNKRHLESKLERDEAQSESEGEKKPEIEDKEDDDDQTRRLSDKAYLDKYFKQRNRVLASAETDDARLLRIAEDKQVHFEKIEEANEKDLVKIRVVDQGYDLVALNEEDPSPIDINRIRINRKVSDEQIKKRLKFTMKLYNYDPSEFLSSNASNSMKSGANLLKTG